MKNYYTIYKVSLYFILSGLLLSQLENEPFDEEKKKKIFYIQATNEAPKIDGKLNESLWQNIEPIKDFIQEYPYNMENPSEKTEVLITYDKRALYVAAKLYTDDISTITRKLSPRDDWYNAFDEVADWFSIEIDSYHDHQTAYAFAVNASGVMYDEMIFNDSDYDSDWNGIWTSEVDIDSLGWNIEMEIPFSNLPFSDKE